MTELLKSLGQSQPNSNTLTALYTVPLARSAVCSTVNVCNTDSQPTKVRLSHAVEGAADARKQYVLYDVPVAGNATRAFTLGVTLAEGDVLRCQSSNGLVAFNAWGAENV